MKPCIVIAGASGAIAKAIAQIWFTKFPTHEFLLISRSPSQQMFKQRMHWYQVSLSDESAVEPLVKYINQQALQVDIWLNTCGFLSNNQVKAEKSLQEVSLKGIQANLEANFIAHLNLLKAADSVSTRRYKTIFIALSAMVGSITDNKLGGWYSYRASKAALNMLVKTTSIEWARNYPKNILVALHPGTTDSQLSKPFQKNISAQRLYSPEQTAKRIDQIVDQLTVADSGHLLHWRGTPLPY
ncbi:SDR family NAD(P)-dependent oxidoreductase [Gayadomonas joobiniege]|uniref:SDR family NAD(P)-dependent oxidoreductase n=1 Tax=Gayadomonas joobiniege TaxID=1234606 RepID=UPI000369C0D3|nr:SDR family NAD(P)-dependent oxidoreductase [Gayadomonas joobiniege]